MKKKLLGCLILFLLFFVGVLFAGVAVKDDGTYSGEATEIDFVDSTVTFDGSKVTVDTSVMASAVIADLTTANGSLNLTDSDNNISLLGNALTLSGTDIYYAGKKLTN